MTIVNKNKRENIREYWVTLAITLTLVENWPLRTLRKKKLSVKDFFSKYVKLHKKKLWICSHLLKKPLTEDLWAVELFFVQQIKKVAWFFNAVPLITDITVSYLSPIIWNCLEKLPRINVMIFMSVVLRKHTQAGNQIDSEKID